MIKHLNDTLQNVFRHPSGACHSCSTNFYKRLQWALDDPKNYYVVWGEYRPIDKSEKGIEITQSTSVANILKLKKAESSDLTDEEALIEFLVVNWAHIIHKTESPHD